MGAGGRPRVWTSPKKMEEEIEKYFELCEGKYLKDANGDYVVNKYGIPVIVDAKPPTVSGLAHYLGFKSKQSLIDYEKNEKFSFIVTRARLRLETYLEERLMDRDGNKGAEFNLRCNYGWTDKSKEVTDEENCGVILIAPVKEDTDGN